MPLEEIEQTPEQAQENQKQYQEKQAKTFEKIMDNEVFKSISIPEEPVSTEKGEKVEQETTEEEGEEPQEEVEAEEEQEELVPKSKIQPRIDSLTAQIKALKEQINQQPKQTDAVEEQLSKMNESELEDTLIQVRIAKEKAREDDATLAKLVKLERQVEKSIAQAPQKFVNKQTQHYQEAVRELLEDPELPQNEDTGKKLLEVARGIYQRYPKLQGIEEGQALALKLAAEHFKETSKFSGDKTELKGLQRQVNTLKKKTSLDTKVLKATTDTSRIQKLRDNASGGTLKDKLLLVKEDPRFNIDAMIPEEYRK